MADIQDQKFAELGLHKATSNKGIASYYRDLDKADNDNPILVLLHGYPQSSYMYGNHATLLFILTG